MVYSCLCLVNPYTFTIYKVSSVAWAQRKAFYNHGALIVLLAFYGCGARLCGGVIIIFVYLTSLLSGAKIASYSPRLVGLVAIIAGARFNINLSPVTPQAQQL